VVWLVRGRHRSVDCTRRQPADSRETQTDSAVRLTEPCETNSSCGNERMTTPRAHRIISFYVPCRALPDLRCIHHGIRPRATFLPLVSSRPGNQQLANPRRLHCRLVTAPLPSPQTALSSFLPLSTLKRNLPHLSAISYFHSTPRRRSPLHCTHPMAAKQPSDTGRYPETRAINYRATKPAAAEIPLGRDRERRQLRPMALPPRAVGGACLAVVITVLISALGPGSNSSGKEASSTADLTPLQRHVAFFDRNKQDGVIYPSETYQGTHVIQAYSTSLFFLSFNSRDKCFYSSTIA
jgi:hypothetical protein